MIRWYFSSYINHRCFRLFFSTNWAMVPGGEILSSQRGWRLRLHLPSWWQRRRWEGEHDEPSKHDFYDGYPMVNKLVDPENHQCLMKTSLPTPMTGRVYVNLPEGIWWLIIGLISLVINGWYDNDYLVGGLEHDFYFSLYIEHNRPNWLSYFSEG